MTDEDLIEQAPRPIPGMSSWVGRHLSWRVIAGAVVLLLVGGAAGYLTGQRDDARMAALPQLSTDPFLPLEQQVDTISFEFLFGERPPLLQESEVVGLGEAVQQTIDVVSDRTALPVLCQTSIGQPGTSNSPTTFPSRTFVMTDGSISELVWTHIHEAQAAGALTTLVAQAVSCPDASSDLVGATTIETSGLRSGIGQQYAVFTLAPLPVPPEAPVAGYVTIVLAHWGPHLVEVSFSSTVDVPNALERAARAARAAVSVIATADR